MQYARFFLFKGKVVRCCWARLLLSDKLKSSYRERVSGYFQFFFSVVCVRVRLKVEIERMRTLSNLTKQDVGNSSNSRCAHSSVTSVNTH